MRAALFESAGRRTGQRRRSLAIGVVALSSGSRPSDDGRDLAVKWSLGWDSLCPSLCLCVSVIQLVAGRALRSWRLCGSKTDVWVGIEN